MDAANRGGGAGTGGGVSAIVEYDYVAMEADELGLVKGAIIHSIKQMPGGWWEGTLQATGERGMFPDNFVRLIDIKDDNKVTMRDKTETSNRRCKVIYSYSQMNDDELSLAVGDVIELLGEVEEGWWRGRLKSKVGVFPSNFVTIIEPSPILASKRPAAPVAMAATATATSTSISSNVSVSNSGPINPLHSSKEDLLNAHVEVAPSLPPKPQREFCRVEYPYSPQNDDELELKVGDVITIITTELPDKGWWKGELHGKVGVFPDNFVKRLPPSEVSPLNDSTQQQPHSQRTAKTTNAHSAAANSSIPATNSSATGVAATTAAITTAATSKVFIKKSGSNSSTQSSNRKDSFGSYDSLNDILSEIGLPSGNVAAQRKSLENKNLDLSNASDASSRLALKKQQLQQAQQQQQQQQQHMHETKTVLTNNGSITTTSTTTTSTASMSSNLSATSEVRKSMEQLDEKAKSPPPPVLTKKPTVPTKKTTTSVTGNFFSGFGKQKTKSSDGKLTTAASHDYADGICTSKMSPSGVADSSSGGVVMRRAATIAVEDSDFDRVERASILPDMRAGRVKAPKRRPPSAAINVIGESNNNNSIYLNGSGGSSEFSHEDGKPQSSDDNSTGEEQLAKPKPREWEKKKAPWMEELKASQVKKKTSPNVEPRTQGVGASNSVADRTSKLLHSDESKVTSSNQNVTSSTTSSSTTKVQSSSVSSSIMQQSMTVESTQQSLKKEHNSGSVADSMTKSMSSKLSTTTVETTANGGSVALLDDVRARPNSLSIRNRSISPSLGETSNGARTAVKSSAITAPTTTTSQANEAASSTTNNNVSSSAAATSATSITANTVVNNHQVKAGGSSSMADMTASRVSELERRVGKLEATVITQQRTIDELVRLLREETDRVKVLRGELDKYAQCVTQV